MVADPGDRIGGTDHARATRRQLLAGLALAPWLA